MNELVKFGLNSKTIEALKAVFARHGAIEKVLIYGSRAKGNFRVGSDIDISLVAPGLNLSDLLKIDNEIEELMLPYKVDLSLFHLIENHDVVEHIKKVCFDFFI